MVSDHVVGTVACTLLDATRSYALGFELEAVSGRRYFLPLALARVGDASVTAASPLHLVDDLESYIRRGAVPADADTYLVLELMSGRVLSAESPTALGQATPR